jgi:hypothetical protein
MAAEAEASREARAKVIAAEGEQKAARFKSFFFSSKVDLCFFTTYTYL